MENNKKHSLMWLAFPAVGLAIAVSYFFALRNDFDAEIGHFATGSVPFLILTVLSVLCCLCSVVLFFMFRSKYVVAAKPKQTPLSIFGIVLCVIMCIGILIGETGILSGFKDVNIPAAISAALTPGIAALLVLCYLSSQKDENRTKNDLFAVVMGILAIISVILKMFAEYFDFSKPINGHVKILTMVMQAFVLLFLVSETRLCFRLDSEKATPGFYVLACALASSVSFGLALGGIVFSIFSRGAANPNLSVMRLALYAAIGIIATDRLLSVYGMTAGRHAEEAGEEQAPSND